MTADDGPAMKLDKSTTFNPEKMFSLAMMASFKFHFTAPEIARRAFPGTRTFLPSCPQWRHRDQRRMLLGPGPLPGSFLNPCSPPPVRTEQRPGRSQRSVLGSLRHVKGVPPPERFRSQGRCDRLPPH